MARILLLSRNENLKINDVKNLCQITAQKYRLLTFPDTVKTKPCNFRRILDDICDYITTACSTETLLSGTRSTTRPPFFNFLISFSKMWSFQLLSTFTDCNCSTFFLKALLSFFRAVTFLLLYCLCITLFCLLEYRKHANFFIDFNVTKILRLSWSCLSS